jgi:hypothetical protein
MSYILYFIILTCFIFFFPFIYYYYYYIYHQSPQKDICPACCVFHNRFRYASRKKNNEPGELADHAGEGIDKYYTTKDTDRRDEEVEQELREACIDLKKDIYATVILEEEDAVKERNKTILEAAEHVKEAQGMREEGNKRIAEALEDQRNELPHNEARRCIIGDFCQNCGIPHLGGCQAGDTYYFSPLNVNVFGIVDCGVEGGALHAYPYHEGMGRKGGDNVASLFMLYLEQKGWLQDGVTGQELTIIMDNCPGQNKNNHVIRLALYLVEAKYFKKVTCLFYIAGHTKNCADRWFNTLKKKYRKMNIYTYDQLCHNFRTNERIEVINYTDGTFKYWKKFCDQFYTIIPTNNVPGGNVLPNHLFVVEEANPTTMVVRRNNLVHDDKSKTFLMKKIGVQFPDRVLALRNRINLETIVEKGIPDIKRKELFCNWRRFVPEDYANEICPYPGPVVLERLRKASNEKTTAKKKALALLDGNKKKRASTTSSTTTTPVRKKKRTRQTDRTASTLPTDILTPRQHEDPRPAELLHQQQIQLQEQQQQQQLHHQQQQLHHQQQLEQQIQFLQQHQHQNSTPQELYHHQQQVQMQLYQQQLQILQQQPHYFDNNTRNL